MGSRGRVDLVEEHEVMEIRPTVAGRIEGEGNAAEAPISIVGEAERDVIAQHRPEEVEQIERDQVAVQLPLDPLQA